MTVRIPRLGALSSRWQATIVAVALVLAFSGGAIAKGQYDASNAHRVDGKHAVGSGASIAQRKGKLVATNPNTGLLPSNIIKRAPDSQKLGGFSKAQLAVLPIVPQGVGVSGNASASTAGVTLSSAGSGEMRFGFVVPPGHIDGEPLLVDAVYEEDSPGACSWYIATSGLEGPDSPTGDDIHNGAWHFPGEGSSTPWEGAVSVPAGQTRAHSITFSWPFPARPGMFVQLGVLRAGDNAADTCGAVTIYGMQVRY